MNKLILLLALSLPLTAFSDKAPPLVSQVSRTRYEVSKSAMEKINPDKQLGTFRVLPAFGAGFMSGVRVSNFGKDCLLPQFGVKSGDVIETVNGQSLGGLNDIQEVGEKLAKAQPGHKVRVNIRRGDEDVIQTYLIVK